MNEQLLNLACGGVLLTAVLVLLRRVPIAVLMVQGAALAGIGAVLADSVELWAITAGILVLRAGLLPYLVRLATSGERAAAQGNVLVALVTAAALTVLGYAVSWPLVELAPSAATQVIPIGVTVVLIGFFVLVARRGIAAQLAGLLLLDNGITAVGLLTSAGVGLLVEVSLALDVLLVLLVVAVRTRQGDLDEVRES